MQFERPFVPSAVVDCLCLFPKTEAAMALGGLLLLLQAGITRAWKERSTLGRGERNGRRNRDHAKESLGNASSSRPRQLKMYGGLHNRRAQKQQQSCFSIAGPEKYPCQNYSRLISLEDMQGWRHMFCLL
jgi:hypothetical protein